MAKEPTDHGDTTSSLITDHPYEPIDEWWSLCKHCRLAQAAHSSSVPEVIEARKAHFATLRHVSPNEVMERERRRVRYPEYLTPEVEREDGRPRVGYIGDDDDD